MWNTITNTTTITSMKLEDALRRASAMAALSDEMEARRLNFVIVSSETQPSSFLICGEGREGHRWQKRQVMTREQ